jgi:hypothetical protein
MQTSLKTAARANQPGYRRFLVGIPASISASPLSGRLAGDFAEGVEVERVEPVACSTTASAVWLRSRRLALFTMPGDYHNQRVQTTHKWLDRRKIW